MAKLPLSEQLDAAIESFLAARRKAGEADATISGRLAAERFYESVRPAQRGTSSRLEQILVIARDLAGLPREGFRMNLKAELERRLLMQSTAQKAPQGDKVRPVPEGHRAVAAYLIVRDAAEAIEFYKKAFGAEEVICLRMPDGKIGHAELQLGDSRIMLSDEFPESGTVSPQSLDGTPVMIHLYVDDADAWANRAVAAGAKVLVAVADRDYGERHGLLEDPFGHRWGISMPLQEDRVKQVRENFPTVQPYLIEGDGLKAIDFYKRVFGAAELMRLTDPDGRIAHAELTLGDSVLMLAGEAPSYGRRSPESVGGTPVRIHVYTDNVDEVAAAAVAAGAKVLRPVADQFYGDRSGQFQDPFGHVWIVSSHIEDVTSEEIERRTAAFIQEREAASKLSAPEREAVTWRREGFTSVTPYLVIRRSVELMDFIKDVFDASETFRQPGPSGGIMHAEVRIGNSMLMLGGSPDMPYPETPAALHCYVENVDRVYRRALAAGATSLNEPTDHDYGERGASVKDAFGNHWYLATPLAGRSVPEGLRSVTPYLHPRSASQVIDFLKRAFDAEEVARYADETGVIRHASVRLGDAMIEMGEAHGPYQPMPGAIFLFVPDVDATHRRALEAGAKAVRQPADQPYGERMSWVTDPFGMHWFLATLLKPSNPPAGA